MEAVQDEQPDSDEGTEEELDDPDGADSNEAEILESGEGPEDSVEPESLPASENPEEENPVEHDTTGLKMEDLGLDSDGETNIRQLSRSPPQSRRDLRQREDEDVQQSRSGKIKEIVSNDVAKRKAQELRKYHSKRSARDAGRPLGSKAKQDRRVKLSDHT
jgi:RIO kinase 2